ncbi:MAG: hypothetical protein K8S87_09030 [Planctomycetes bacterium]|nr:hypothetical protein [Planctomycetota bacterium]
MKKFLAVLFVVFALFVAGCGKGTTGFDKPEDLATKVISLRSTMEKGNLSAMLDITYFANAGDKAKVKQFFDATKDITKQMMEMAKKFQPEGKFTFKEKKIEGDKGQLIFSDGSSMDIVRIGGKWFMSSKGAMFKDALTKDIKDYKEEMKKMLPDLNISEEDAKKMKEGLKMFDKLNESKKTDK